ncbi:MAG TPA: hypothetical protein VLY83_05410 [Methanoregula sp.]|nr:hypothetical protein [Methanoregula sp.]
MEAVEGITGQKKREDAFLGFGMVQEVFGIEFYEIELEAFLNPGKALLRYWSAEKKKMGIHVVLLA